MLLGQLLALVLTLANSSIIDFDWTYFGLSSFQVQWILLLNAALLCQVRSWLARLSRIKAGCFAFAMVIAVTLICSLLGQVLVLPSVSWALLAEHLLFSAILGGVILRYLYLQQQLENRQRSEARARLDALQARIHPHFLFNALNTVASLVAIDSQKAEKTIEDLAELLRASLKQPSVVPVASELALCSRYMAIESLRFGSRLRYRETIDAQAEDLLEKSFIPNLLLQPLLENAIQHGIQAKRAGGDIVCAVKTDGGSLFIEVTNPLPDRSVSRQSGNRIALDNIRDRLKACFGSEAALSVVSNEEHFCAVVKVPLGKDRDRFE